MGEGQSSPPFRLAVTPHFRTRAGELSEDERRALARAVRLFQDNPQDPRLHVHKLRGPQQDQWAFSFGYDARVVFVWEGRTAVLLDVGSHEEVYG